MRKLMYGFSTVICAITCVVFLLIGAVRHSHEPLSYDWVWAFLAATFMFLIFLYSFWRFRELRHTA